MFIELDSVTNWDTNGTDIVTTDIVIPHVIVVVAHGCVVLSCKQEALKPCATSLMVKCCSSNSTIRIIVGLE
jgi:hypothetical protein